MASKLELTVIHATQGCEDTTCPTIYQSKDGRFVIQGFKINPADKAGIEIPEGEDAVIVPQEFIEAFLAKQPS